MGDREVFPDEIANQIADYVKIAVVITVAQPFEKETVARPIASGIVDVAAFHVGQHLMQGIGASGKDRIARGARLDPLLIGDVGTFGIGTESH